MKTRAMRWTDEGWADVLLIGMDRVRELVAKEAAKVRKQQRQRVAEAAQQAAFRRSTAGFFGESLPVTQ